MRRASSRSDWLRPHRTRRLRGQHQRLFHPDDLSCSVRVDDCDARDPALLFVDDDLLGVSNQVVIAVERDIEQVVFLVVGDYVHRAPFGGDLVAEIE